MNASQTAVILLAGGRSSRMGTPKHSLLWNGQTFLETLYGKAGTLGPVLVSANEPLFINGCAVECVPDSAFFRESCGPLAGIAACMKASAHTKYIVLPIDTPQIPAALPRALADAAWAGDWDCVMLSHSGWVEPLISVFDRRVLPALERAIARGEYSVKQAVAGQRTLLFPYEGPDENVAGFNTKDEYSRAAKGGAAAIV